MCIYIILLYMYIYICKYGIYGMYVMCMSVHVYVVFVLYNWYVFMYVCMYVYLIGEIHQLSSDD